MDEKRWAFISQFYNKDMVMGLTGLEEAEADSFMIYFNSKGILNSTNNEYQVRFLRKGLADTNHQGCDKRNYIGQSIQYGFSTRNDFYEDYHRQTFGCLILRGFLYTVIAH